MKTALLQYDEVNFSVWFDTAGRALAALALTHLVGKDLRQAGVVMDRFLLDLLMASQETFGNRISQSGLPLSFQISNAPDLEARLQRAFNQVPCGIHLVGRSSKLNKRLEGMFSKSGRILRIVDSIEKLGRLPTGDLVLIDATTSKERLPSPVGLDHLVIKLLVAEAQLEPLGQGWTDRIIPIATGPRKPQGWPTSYTKQDLMDALEEAQFSHVFEQCRASHLGWQTHQELAYDESSNRVIVSLNFDAEVRKLQAKDLKQDIPWAEIPTLGFADVLGLDPVKERLQEDLAWLRDPAESPGVRAHVLSGPPGTGKTHACLATAGEAGVPCILMAGSEFISKWYGESERMIRETFAALQQYDAAVLVIDEFDAIAWRRDQSPDGEGIQQSRMIGQMLHSLDLLRQGRGRILVLATTNQYERIDPALVRSMRMGDRIHVGLPQASDRRKILLDHLSQELTEAELDELVGMTTGFSPADLVHLLDEARKAAKRASAPLSFTHIQTAVLRLRQGATDPSLCLSAASKRRVAVHEAGHALLSYQLLGAESVEHITLLPNASGALGATYQHAPERLELADRSTVERRLAVLLAGRAAESLAYPETGASCGAEHDLRQATALASLAVAGWGLDPGFPLLNLEALPPNWQQGLTPKLLDRLQHWMASAEATALGELTRHGEELDRLAHRLLEAETLHRSDLLEILGAENTFALHPGGSPT